MAKAKRAGKTRVPAGRHRQRLGVDERREQLVELGLRLFHERPYDDISIDDIAAAGGVSKGLLYHYFESKHGFYVAVVRAGAEHMRRMTEPDPSLPPRQRLEASLDAYLDYVERHGRGYLSLLRSGVGADPAVAAIVEDMRQVVILRVLRGLSIRRASPSLRMALRAWVGFIEGASLDAYEHGDVDRAVMKALLVGALQTAVETCAAHGGVTIGVEAHDE